MRVRLFALATFVALCAFAQPVNAQTPATEAEVAALLARCDAGDAVSCGDAAVNLLDTDMPRARTLFDRGCTGGAPPSCIGLALTLISGPQDQRDYARAAPLLDRACTEGSGASCAALSNMAYLGVGVPEDKPRALALTERGCTLRDARACTGLGLYMSAGEEFPRDLAKASSALLFACRENSPDACAILENVAVLVVQDTDPRAPRASGLALFEAACAGEQMRSCGVAGAFWVEGLFGPSDPARGATLYQRGCDLGHAMACADLAELYRRGRGVERDRARARTLAERAVELDPNNEEAARVLRRLR